MRVCLIALVVLGACTSDGSNDGNRGISDGELEQVCRSWCSTQDDTGLNCGGNSTDPSFCLEECEAYDAFDGVCGIHDVYRKQCELELDCKDEFGDCDVHEEARFECADMAFESCNACVQSVGEPAALLFEACLRDGGECNEALMIECASCVEDNDLDSFYANICYRFDCRTAVGCSACPGEPLGECLDSGGVCPSR